VRKLLLRHWLLPDLNGAHGAERRYQVVPQVYHLVS